MVKLTYTSTSFDLKYSLVERLWQIWNFNTHTDKHKYPDCLTFEYWAIGFVKTKWEPDFVDFELAI